LKRSLDVVLSLLLLVMTMPFSALVALLIRWNMGAPVVFRQRRPGLGGRPFTLLKFRTMSIDGREVPVLGRRLRALSLDEIPQLWNVLRGDMALVGPRPLLMEYLPRYSDEQARRHEVTPGMTGWAQVNGRNAVNWHTQFQLDVWYVDHASIALDVRILFLTVLRCLRRDGGEANSAADRAPFNGKPLQPD
jgi:lipopolysaccharide/colanic/teichoic acid biosynthesis glycosyltransferase